MSLIQAGKLFHVRGPATENALSPSVVRVLGMTSVVESADLRTVCRPVTETLSAARYGGACPWRHL